MWIPLIRTFGICFRIHTPRLRRTPLKEGTRGGGPSVASYGCCVWMQAARRQRPHLKGVPRQWRGMYTAGGASMSVDSASKDFWYLFWDTYPPASPYPSEEGTRGGGSFVDNGV